MLDISIVTIEKITRASAEKLIKEHIKVVEKIDGTKLTLIRNDTAFDPGDLHKNWIVSYKGNVIYPGEVSGLIHRDEDIKRDALGSSQYKFVFDHLQRVHENAAPIPKNTEFFVEFVQHKPTITRDYTKKHGMFLIGFGDASYVVSRGQLYSTSSFIDDPVRLKKYRDVLQLQEFPLLFEGTLSSYEESVYTHPRLRDEFENLFKTIDFSDPFAVLAAAASSFRSLESSLGGPSEGVVIQTQGAAKRLYKVLAADQHDSATRAMKKQRYKGTEAEEKAYWEAINSTVDTILDDLYSKMRRRSENVAMCELSRIVYSLRDTDIRAYHPVKKLINKQEDVMLTAKTRVFVLGHRHRDVAVIPMAAKPFHAGHESLLDAAAADENELIIVYLSSQDRDEVSSADMVSLWRDHYLPRIQEKYGERVLIRFMVGSSPLYELRMSVTNIVRQTPSTVVRIYGDPHDATSRVDGILCNTKNAIPLEGRVRARTVDRSKTGGVSGSGMRKFLSTGDRESFLDRLPSFLDLSDKESIWNRLAG